MSSLTTPRTHGSLPISNDHISFPETAVFVQNHLNVLAASCAAQLLETAGASFPPQMEGKSFCFTPKKCSLKSSNPALFAPGQEFLCTNTSHPALEREKGISSGGRGELLHRGPCKTGERDERALILLLFSTSRNDPYHLLCLRSSLQSPDLDHTEYLTRRSVALSQGQAALWDVVCA